MLGIPADLASRRGSYGIDEPRWPALLLGVGTASLGAAAAARRRSWCWAALPALWGLSCVGSAACYLSTTRWGKFAVWEEVLRGLALRGDETVLDVGCGRGAVLLMAAKLVPRGRAIGLDVWRVAEQSRNGAGVTRRNAELEGVADRVELQTADMIAVPLPDASVDVVVSSLAIHNLPRTDDRRRALDEALRVLKPGGRFAIADIHYVVGEYADHLRARAEAVAVRDLGWRFWYGGPWVATRLVTGRRG